MKKEKEPLGSCPEALEKLRRSSDLLGLACGTYELALKI
jgi:hypothetical protein